MRLLLFCSAFNGLSQRVWLRLRALGHTVFVHLASDVTTIEDAARTIDPELILCPFLKDRVPECVWRRYRTLIVHPGPPGDRGPSSLDWALMEGHRTWGVTIIQAVEEMDAGPIWASRTFRMPAEPCRKSVLYNRPVADAAVDMVDEVLLKASDPSFMPEVQDSGRPYRTGRPHLIGRLRPAMTQADRAFSWDESTDAILTKIRAADGAPGVRVTLGGRTIRVFDGHRGPVARARPGALLGTQNGAVRVATGDGSIWVGHARLCKGETGPSFKLPASVVLKDQRVELPVTLARAHAPRPGHYNDVTYRRFGDVGVVRFDFYNGGMSTSQCRRLRAALRHATAQDTRVLVLRGGETFSNGIHLNVIEAAPSPGGESWANINAIDDVCRAIIECTQQLVVTSMGANAGAGGVMLGLGADRVFARDAVVLNPHYASMGLYGSEYWTYVLPRRTGRAHAEELTQACLPIGAEHAAEIGLVDEVIGGRSQPEFEREVLDAAARLAASRHYGTLLRKKQRERELDQSRRPLSVYRNEELSQMAQDIFDDRSGYDEARRAFVNKEKPTRTPRWLTAA